MTPAATPNAPQSATCPQCAQSAADPTNSPYFFSAGLEMSLRIGQHVRHRNHMGMRVTGHVRGLSIDSERVLQADIVLDVPIVIPPVLTDGHDIKIWHQHVPAHELTPFDDRDELIAEMLAALRSLHAAMACYDGTPEEHLALTAAQAAIAKATGGAA